MFVNHNPKNGSSNNQFYLVVNKIQAEVYIDNKTESFISITNLKIKYKTLVKKYREEIEI